MAARYHGCRASTVKRRGRDRRTTVGRSGRPCGRPATMAAMLPDGRRLGAHLPSATAWSRPSTGPHEIGATALQIFSDNPTAWQRRPRHRRTSRPSGSAWPSSTSARSRSTPPTWSTWPARSPTSTSARSSVLAARPGERARVRGARSSTSTPGRTAGAGPAEPGVGRLADGGRPRSSRERRRRRRTPPMLVLENSAGGGDVVGSTVEELADIADAHRGARACRPDASGSASTPPMPGAPATGSPIRTRSTPSSIDFDAPDRARPAGDDPPERLAGPSSARGLDRHEHVGAGRIGPAGCGALLRHPRLGGATYYLETPGHGRGLRRHQHGPGARPRRRTAARAAAARGVRARRGSDAVRDAPTRRGERPTRPASPCGDAASAATPAVDRSRPDRRDAATPLRRPRARARARRPRRHPGPRGGPPLRRPADARHVGRRPGPRHARPARARPATASSRCSGPPTSIGDFHHGVLYYYLLAPAALLSRRRSGRGDGDDRPRAGSRRSRSRGGWRGRSAARSRAFVAAC